MKNTTEKCRRAITRIEEAQQKLNQAVIGINLAEAGYARHEFSMANKHLNDLIGSIRASDDTLQNEQYEEHEKEKNDEPPPTKPTGERK